MPDYKFLGSTVWSGSITDTNKQEYILANKRTPTDFTETYGLCFESYLDCGDWKKTKKQQRHPDNSIDFVITFQF